MILLVLLAASCTAPQRRFEVSRPKMGTRFRVAFYCSSADRAARAIEAVYARMDELNALLSDYDPTSELSVLSAKSDTGPTAAMSASPELIAVLVEAQRWSAVTEGAFDATLGPLVRLWRRSARQEELPSAERLAAARAASGWERLEVDSLGGTLQLNARGMRLDLGGIAKGYALDECLRVLREQGIERALIDGGGDVRVGTAPPGAKGWLVVLDPLGDGADRIEFELEHAAVATSGDRYRSVEIEGVQYSHLIDPRTGLGLTQRVAASVIAPNGVSADALATAACVLGGERAVRILAGIEGVECRVVQVEGEDTAVFETQGFEHAVSASSH